MSNDARRFADDPRDFFGTASQMYGVPYPEIQELQLDALRQRFEGLRVRVPLLARLAERNDVTKIAGLEQGARLLYPSNVYKSYPFAWLSEGRYDQLTRWLQQLTAHDMAGVNLKDVGSLDEWFGRIEDVTNLRVCHSSSTSGKLSFVPRGVDEWVRRAATLPFAEEAAGRDDGPPHVSFADMPLVSTFYVGGHSATLMHTEWFIKVHTDPDGTHPERVVSLYPGTMSSELMVLAGRLRSGQLNGDPRSVRIPERLSNRRAELTGLLEGTTGERMDAFVSEAATKLGGQRCFVNGVWPTVVDAAVAARSLGLSDVFDPTSIVSSGGGSKGRDLPDDAYELVRAWTGVPTVSEGYGMSELMGFNGKCSAGWYHLNPWLIPYVLDEGSLEPLPAHGQVAGRLAGIDLMSSSYWSGFISTDVVTLRWDPACACGRLGPSLAPDIRRVQGDSDDKISCAATPGAHDATIEFLRAQGA